MTEPMEARNAFSERLWIEDETYRDHETLRPWQLESEIYQLWILREPSHVRVYMCLEHCGTIIIHSDLLFFITVDRQCRPPIFSQVFRDIIGNPFCWNKNQYFGVLCANLIQVFDQFCLFLKIAAHFHNLLDIVICCEFHGTDIHLNHILQKILIMMTF